MNKISLFLFLSLIFPTQDSFAQYKDWKYSGFFSLLTTPEGANLPAGIKLNNFPLLIRLYGDGFDFSQAGKKGEDLRFKDELERPLAFKIEEWDPGNRQATIWVQIPVIEGASRQKIKMYWGNPKTLDLNELRSVFDSNNHYLSVWHLGEQIRDEVGTLKSKDHGTKIIPGIIGKARHFPGGKGVYCGDKIQSYPSGKESTHTTQAWIRPENSRGRIISWGTEEAQGKVQMWYTSPPGIRMDCYFSDADVRGFYPDKTSDWVHVVHTYNQGKSLLYIDGQLVGRGNPRATRLNVKKPARLWLGGWYNNYDYIGGIDEVRVSSVARSPHWVRLEYENQKPLQTLVGPLIQEGHELSVDPKHLSLREGEKAAFQLKAGGAEKIFWVLNRGQKETIVSVDRFNYTFDAGRIRKDEKASLEIRAIYPDEIKTLRVPIRIKEHVPEPEIKLSSPKFWDGRKTIELKAEVSNLKTLEESGVQRISYKWEIEGLATIHKVDTGTLILSRSQNSGELKVKLKSSNGGPEVSNEVSIEVKEPRSDPWMQRQPSLDEKPLEKQFYARGEDNQGTLYYNGKFEGEADSVFLKVFKDKKQVQRLEQKLGRDQRYAFTVKLESGLFKYHVEFGSVFKGEETLVSSVGDLMCGDAFIIEGQSNALATDTREKSPPVTHPWIRSWGTPKRSNLKENLWCHPVWKARHGEKAELGWWGMELAKNLVERHRVPICIINGARGGTRIDQHQRDEKNPTNLDTIYGRLLWRVRQAKLTHGIKAILWHQGENDQGAAGPDGGYGWETYQKYFVQMASAWKRDFPNVKKYYVFQIWPNACSMGNGNGDMLREVQRTLPRLFSNMEIMSTLGITPPGGCHFPLKGWAKIATRIQPIIDRDFYQKHAVEKLTPPNVIQAGFLDSQKTEIKIRFDQVVKWKDGLERHFYIDDENNNIVRGEALNNEVTLYLSQSSNAEKLTYLKEKFWNYKLLLRGENGIAALSFCNIPLYDYSN